MKVFLSGATGFVGSAVLKRLAAAGHSVRGLVQDPAKAQSVRDAGAEPVIGDLLAPSPWADAVQDCDIVISASSPFNIIEKLTRHEAARRAESHAEMVVNLIQAARKSNVQAIILTYHVTALGNQGDKWVSELITINPAGLSRPIADTYWDIEKQARRADLPTIEVFPGWVYGPGSWFRRYVVDRFISGSARIVGPGNNYMSLIHVDDLAEGYKLILDKMPIGERYCMVDSHPVMQREFINFVARQMGKALPQSIDYHTFMLNMGEVLAEAFDSSVRVSNNKAKKELGFKPVYDSFCHGVPEALKALGIEPTEVRKAAGF